MDDLQHAQVSPSTYTARKAEESDPGLRSACAQRDEVLREDPGQNFEVYGPRKVWRQLRREGVAVARCTVERLMGELGLKGAVRGGAKVRTTIPGNRVERPFNSVRTNLNAERPNQLWVSDLTYVATWRGSVHVAFVIDAYSRPTVS